MVVHSAAGVRQRVGKSCNIKQLLAIKESRVAGNPGFSLLPGITEL